MTITAMFHRAESAFVMKLDSVKNDGLHFTGEGGEFCLYVPPHVAAHTAAAFNRAMQARPIADGYAYTGKTGEWRISRDAARGQVWFAQHDEITGDKDPTWMFADACSLLGVLDEIDRIEDQESCSVCCTLVGEDRLTECGDSWLCDDCHRTEAERERGMREMAEDDKAHAAMERAAGL